MRSAWKQPNGTAFVVTAAMWGHSSRHNPPPGTSVPNTQPDAARKDHAAGDPSPGLQITVTLKERCSGGNKVCLQCVPGLKSSLK